MAGSASTIPVSARGVGRSPNSSPASTENPAEATALNGAVTLNAAFLNPRYNANAPSVPPSPAPKPQGRSGVVGPGGGGDRRRGRHDHPADHRREQRDLDDRGAAGGEAGGEVRTPVTDRGRQRQDDG